MGPTPKCHFLPKLPSGNFKIPKNGTLATLESHNFVWKPLIEMSFQAKLFPLLRAFQQYVACNLHARESRWFQTFNGWMSNWQFDSHPFIWPYLCFRYQNGSCEPILDIYVPRAFQWYKELFNLMNSNPCNCFLKIWKSIGTPNPKMGAHLGVWGFIPSHSSTFPGTWNVIPELHS
jgi:hypothetical protein